LQGSTLTTYKVMAVWMMRCTLLLQKLSGHISEVSNQNKLNFGLVWFLYGPKLCANFQRNLNGCRFFCWFGMEWPLHYFLTNAFRQALLMAVATGLISSLFNVASSWDIPFGQTQWLHCLHHGSTEAYLCSPLCSIPLCYTV